MVIDRIGSRGILFTFYELQEKYGCGRVSMLSFVRIATIFAILIWARVMSRK